MIKRCCVDVPTRRSGVRPRRAPVTSTLCDRASTMIVVWSFQVLPCRRCVAASRCASGRRRWPPPWWPAVPACSRHRARNLWVSERKPAARGHRATAVTPSPTARRVQSAESWRVSRTPMPALMMHHVPDRGLEVSGHDVGHRRRAYQPIHPGWPVDASWMWYWTVLQGLSVDVGWKRSPRPQRPRRYTAMRRGTPPRRRSRAPRRLVSWLPRRLSCCFITQTSRCGNGDRRSVVVVVGADGRASPLPTFHRHETVATHRWRSATGCALRPSQRRLVGGSFDVRPRVWFTTPRYGSYSRPVLVSVVVDSRPRLTTKTPSKWRHHQGLVVELHGRSQYFSDWCTGVCTQSPTHTFSPFTSAHPLHLSPFLFFSNSPFIHFPHLPPFLFPSSLSLLLFHPSPREILFKIQFRAFQQKKVVPGNTFLLLPIKDFRHAVCISRCAYRRHLYGASEGIA